MSTASNGTRRKAKSLSISSVSLERMRHAQHRLSALSVSTRWKLCCLQSHCCHPFAFHQKVYTCRSSNYEEVESTWYEFFELRESAERESSRRSWTLSLTASPPPTTPASPHSVNVILNLLQMLSWENSRALSHISPLIFASFLSTEQQRHQIGSSCENDIEKLFWWGSGVETFRTFSSFTLSCLHYSRNWIKFTFSADKPTMLR